MISYDNHINTAEPAVIQFENANEGRSYPFVDNAVLISNDGSELPDTFISDARLFVPSGYEAFVSSVHVSQRLLSVCIKISDKERTMALAVTISPNVFSPYTPYRMEKLVGSEDIGGVITFGDIDFPEHPVTYRFKDNVAILSESVISRFKPSVIRSFIDDRTGERITGDVKIEFSSKHISASHTEDGVLLKLAEESKYALLPKCERERVTNPCGSTPIKSINGIKPDSSNRIVLWFH